MLLTENEAENTHCPITDGYCAASQCMAWRWGEPNFTIGPDDVQKPIGEARRGFCGLAGRPE